jgi:hypothetical protein
MLLGVANKRVCAVGVVAVKNEKSVTTGCIASTGNWFKMFLHPLHTKFLICPPVQRECDAREAN